MRGRGWHGDSKAHSEAAKGEGASRGLFSRFRRSRNR
jgi:hypothetical protein